MRTEEGPNIYSKNEKKLLNFKYKDEDGNEITEKVECKQIDLNSEEWSKKFENAPEYKKTCGVKIAEEVNEEKVVEVGLDAAEEKVEPGDKIIYNVGNPDNKWPIKKEEFGRQYKEKEGEPGVYISRSIDKAIQVKENVFFKTDRGEEAVRTGGYIVKEGGKRKELHGVNGKIFEETYKEVEKEEEE